MSDINVGAFSEALNAKADIDLRNIDTNKCDVVIEYQEPTAENSYQWYRLYASGWCEQGGLVGGGNDDVTVNFLIEMANTNYQFLGSPRESEASAVSMVVFPYISTRTTTSMVLRRTYGGGRAGETFCWEIKGIADMTHHEILPNPTSNTARALVIQVLDDMYPIGSLFFGTQAVCPMSAFFGTWELVSTTLTTGVDATAAVKGNGMTLGVTDGTLNHGVSGAQSGLSAFNVDYGKSVGTARATGGSYINGTTIGLTTDPTKSGVVAEVSSDALSVNVWRRTA